MDVLKVLSWRSQDSLSQEYFTLSQGNDSYVLKGTLVAFEASPPLISYQIECDKQWQTKFVRIHQEIDGKTNDLGLNVNKNHVWFNRETALPSFNGLLDVDLEFSPSTNTLPIRRLNLMVGESKAIEAVWVRFEGLKLERSCQKYSKIGSKRYLYEYPSANFSAILEVDKLGLIVKYGDLWRRLT